MHCVRKNWKRRKQILDEAKAGVEQEQANMEALIDQKSRDITAYESRYFQQRTGDQGV